MGPQNEECRGECGCVPSVTRGSYIHGGANNDGKTGSESNSENSVVMSTLQREESQTPLLTQSSTTEFINPALGDQANDTSVNMSKIVVIEAENQSEISNRENSVVMSTLPRETSQTPLLTQSSTTEFINPTLGDQGNDTSVNVPEITVKESENQSKCTCKSVMKFVKSKLLAILSIAGIIVGFALGLGIRQFNPSDDALMWLAFPGDMFLKLLKMTIVPLIVSSVITATASMDPKQNGKIGAIQVTYLALTNLLGAVMGLIIGVTIQPGSHVSEGSNMTDLETRDSTQMQTQDVVADLLRNLIPDNVIRATMQKAYTSYEVVNPAEVNSSQAELEVKRVIDYTNSTNVIGLIVICVIFGLAAGKAKEKGEAFLAFFRSASEIVLIVIGWFLWVSPIGICSLIASSLASIDNISTTFMQLGLFVGAVSAGLALHQLVVMPLIHLATVRTNPFLVLARSYKAWLVGFASTSSAGSMPYMYAIADDYKIDKRVSSFCIPIGVTLNADGSALFICASVLFVAQRAGIVLTGATELAVIGALTTVSTLALPSVPSSSIVVIVIIVTTLGIPASSIGLLFTVEWLLDRLRTTSNVVTEIFAFIFVWHMTKKDLNEMEKIPEKMEKKENVAELHKTDFGSMYVDVV